MSSESATSSLPVDAVVLPPIDRAVPAIGGARLRLTLGALFAALGPFTVAAWRGLETPDLVWTLTALLLAWWPAVWATDKYRHKYPYRYDSYLLASHGKSAILLTLLLSLFRWVIGTAFALDGPIVLGLALAAGADLIVALPRRRESLEGRPRRSVAAAVAVAPAEPTVSINGALAVAAIASDLDPAMRDFLSDAVPQEPGGLSDARVVDDREHGFGRSPVDLLVGGRPLNAVRRLNLYLQEAAATVRMGGCIAVRYTPLEESVNALRERVPGPFFGPAYLLHFAWYRAIPKLPWLDVLYFSKPFSILDKLFYRPDRGRNRVLSRSEVWGRLAFYGFEVLREVPVGRECLVLARRLSPPVANRKPSYYAVVALEKVGLDGDVIRLYKVRSMFPFSEFLQKKIFETNGLSATGKFKNDFRLTEYGPLIRRSWLDELPGILNWLRGDVKLVGMRATSPHFLGLYPPSVYERYIRVKPGLVPPIFDEKTAGFQQIVEIEETYLRRYLDAPVRTDIAYFWYTFRDIFIRRVRSH